MASASAGRKCVAEMALRRCICVFMSQSDGFGMKGRLGSSIPPWKHSRTSGDAKFSSKLLVEE